MKSHDIKIDTATLREYSIFVATPMYGGSCFAGFTNSCIQLTSICKEYGIGLRFNFLTNESLIPRARNYLTDDFLTSDATHMMFIDADITFDPLDVIRLLGIQVQNADKYDVIGAVYPKKTVAWEKIQAAVKAGIFDENPHDLSMAQADFVLNVGDPNGFSYDEVTAAKHIGTGFMLIPRNTFDVYKAAYPEYSYLPDHSRSDNFDGTREIVQYFSCEIDPKTRTYASEDYFFCNKVHDAGMGVYFCPWMSSNLVHTGTHQFRGSIEVLAAIGMTSTSDEKSNPKNYKNPNKKVKK